MIKDARYGLINPINGLIMDVQTEMSTIRILPIIATESKFIRYIDDNAEYKLGTVLYRLSRPVAIQKWYPIGGTGVPTGVVQYTPTHGDTIGIDLNIMYAVGLIYPNIDFERLGQERDLLWSQYHEWLAMSITYTLDFNLMRMVNEFCGTQYSAGKTQYVIFFNDGPAHDFIPTAGKDADEISENMRNIIYAGTKMSKTITNNIYTLNNRYENIVICLDAMVGTYFSTGVSRLTYAEKAYESLLHGWQYRYDIGGYAVSESLFFDQIIEQSSVDKERPVSETYHFENLLGIMYFTQALAQPTNFKSVVEWLETVNFFPISIHKFVFGQGILRPDLVRVIVRKGATWDETLKAWKNPVNKTTTKVKNMSDEIKETAIYSIDPVSIDNNNGNIKTLEEEEGKSTFFKKTKK